MPDASPARWHLAHVSWFFETFVLRPRAADYRALDERYGDLFNSYYNGVGPQLGRRSAMSSPSAATATRLWPRCSTTTDSLATSRPSSIYQFITSSSIR